MALLLALILPVVPAQAADEANPLPEVSVENSTGLGDEKEALAPPIRQYYWVVGGLRYVLTVEMNEFSTYYLTSDAGWIERTKTLIRPFTKDVSRLKTRKAKKLLQAFDRYPAISSVAFAGPKITITAAGNRDAVRERLVAIYAKQFRLGKPTQVASVETTTMTASDLENAETYLADPEEVKTAYVIPIEPEVVIEEFVRDPQLRVFRFSQPLSANDVVRRLKINGIQSYHLDEDRLRVRLWPEYAWSPYVEELIIDLALGQR
jgi:hypothetical protein